jgi:hypothetical protein
MRLSIIVPSCGRPSLLNTLNSLVVPPLLFDVPDSDEVIVVGCANSSVLDYAVLGVRYFPCAMGHDWGCAERTTGMQMATGTHLAFIDDDDAWTPNARVAIDRAISAYPDRPILFQMRYPSGRVLWADPELRSGNVSTQMIVIPNDPNRLGKWTPRREGDFDFLASMKWPASDIVWIDEVIAQMGTER